MVARPCRFDPGSGYKASRYVGGLCCFSRMASVYILFSNKLNNFYIGSCKDLSYRIDQHLNKEFAGSFTARAEDWILYLSIDELQYQQARAIEEHLKRMKSKAYIQNLLKYPEIIERLKIKYE